MRRTTPRAVNRKQPRHPPAWSRVPSWTVARLASIVLLSLFAFLVTEPAYAQQDSRRVGIGAAISNGYGVFPQSEADTISMPVILIPIQVTDGFRLEPEIGVFRSSDKEVAPGRSDDEASVNSVNGVEVGLGVFSQVLQQNF